MLQGIVVFTDGRSTEGSSTGFGQLEEHAKRGPRADLRGRRRRGAAAGQDRDRRPARAAADPARRPFPGRGRDHRRGAARKRGQSGAGIDLRPQGQGRQGGAAADPVAGVHRREARRRSRRRSRPSAWASGCCCTRPRRRSSTRRRRRASRSSSRSTPTPWPPPPASTSRSSSQASASGRSPRPCRTPSCGSAPACRRTRKRSSAPRSIVSDPAGMIVQKKPLRILLFAGAATHEYQFVQSLLVREMDKKRVKVAVYLQLPPGRTEMREGIVQDAPLLKRFPDQFDRKFARRGREALRPERVRRHRGLRPRLAAVDRRPGQVLKQWADKGGGLIYVAGPVNTLQLARPAGAQMDRLKPILQLLPVTLRDIRLEEANRDTNRGLAARLLRGHAGHGVFEAGGGDRRQGAAEVPGRLEGLLRPGPARRQRQPRLLQLLPGGQRQAGRPGGGPLRRPVRQAQGQLAHAVYRLEQPGRPRPPRRLAGLGRDVAAAAEE